MRDTVPLCLPVQLSSRVRASGMVYIHATLAPWPFKTDSGKMRCGSGSLQTFDQRSAQKIFGGCVSPIYFVHCSIFYLLLAM